MAVTTWDNTSNIDGYQPVNSEGYQPATFADGSTPSSHTLAKDWGEYHKFLHQELEIDSEKTKSEQKSNELYQLINDLNVARDILEKEKDRKRYTINILQLLPKDIVTTLNLCANILDKITGRQSEAAAQKLIALIRSFVNCILSCVTPFKNIGINVNVPFLDELLKILQEIQRANELLDSLPDEIKNQIEEKKEKWHIYDSVSFDLPKSWLKPIERIKEDIEWIAENWKLLPIIFLYNAIMVVVDLLKEVFDTLGLKAFDFSKLLEVQIKSSLSFDFLGDINAFLKNLENKTPNNIIEAIIYVIPLVIRAKNDLPEMIKKAFIGQFKDLMFLQVLCGDKTFYQIEEQQLSILTKYQLSAESLLSHESLYHEKLMDMSNKIKNENSIMDDMSKQKQQATNNPDNYSKNESFTIEYENKMLQTIIDAKDKEIERLTKTIEAYDDRLTRLEEKFDEGILFAYPESNTEEIVQIKPYNLKEENQTSLFGKLANDVKAVNSKVDTALESVRSTLQTYSINNKPAPQ